MTLPSPGNTVLVQGPARPQLSAWWVIQLQGRAAGRRQLNGKSGNVERLLATATAGQKAIAAGV